LSRERFGETGEVIQTMGALAVALRRTGQLDEAEVLQTEAVEKGRRVFGPRSPNFGVLLNNLARVEQSRGNHRAAVPHFRETIDILGENLGEDHYNVATAWSNLAGALLELGEEAEAETLYRRAIGVLEQALPEGDVRIALPHVGLGRLLQRRGLDAEAEPYLRRALALREAERPEGHPAVAEVRALLGRSLARLGRVADAEALLLAAHDALPAGAEATQLAPLLRDLADLYAATARPAEARRYRELLAALESHPGS
jgi:tetratricopeptide (TPR) repeat protein